MKGWNMYSLLKYSVFRGHVSFRGLQVCNSTSGFDHCPKNRRSLDFNPVALWQTPRRPSTPWRLECKQTHQGGVSYILLVFPSKKKLDHFGGWSHLIFDTPMISSYHLGPLPSLNQRTLARGLERPPRHTFLSIWSYAYVSRCTKTNRWINTQMSKRKWTTT